MKYGRCERISERHRKEEQEHEHAIDLLNDDEQEQAIKDLERHKRSRQSELLALGRSILSGKSPF
jgi:hypothetical protein